MDLLTFMDIGPHPLTKQLGDQAVGISLPLAYCSYFSPPGALLIQFILQVDDDSMNSTVSSNGVLLKI